MEPVISGAADMGEKVRVLRETIDGSILPQIVWLTGPAGRLGVVVADQRVHGIRVMGADGERLEQEIFVLASQSDKPRALSRVRERLFGFLGQQDDLTQEFEELLEELDPEQGVSGKELLTDDGKPLRLSEVVQEVAEPNSAPTDLEPDDAQVTLLNRLQGHLGQKLMSVWIPTDEGESVVGIVVDGDDVEIEEMAPQQMGRYLQKHR